MFHQIKYAAMIFRGFYLNMATGNYSPSSARGGHSLPMKCTGRQPMSRRLLAPSKSGRKPMFVFTFDRTLFRFSAATPSFPALFQFPNRIGMRYTTALFIFCRLSPQSLGFYPSSQQPTNFVYFLHPKHVFFAVNILQAAIRQIYQMPQRLVGNIQFS